MRIALAIGGIVVGFGMLGLAVNNHLSEAWDILTGQASLANAASSTSSTKNSGSSQGTHPLPGLGSF